jgi:hypothetical protein
MASPSLPDYKDAEIEMRASAFLASHYGSDVRIPVDPDWLLEQMRITLDCYPKLRANHHVEGMVCRDVETGGLIVFIDEDGMDDQSARGITRYRTTVAEEWPISCSTLRSSRTSRVQMSFAGCTT